VLRLVRETGAVSDSERPVRFEADGPPKLTPEAAHVLVRLFRAAMRELHAGDSDHTGREPAA
jgi:hypothetical protein